MEIKGTVYSVGEIKEISDNFLKKEFILKTSDGKFDNYIQIQLSNKNIELITASDVGTNVTATVNVKGRLWKNKEDVEVAFNTLDAWKIIKETSNF